MFFVYILYSDKLDRCYVGYSEDPVRRLKTRHNLGKVKATKSGIPYKLMATKSFLNEVDAIRKELKK